MRYRVKMVYISYQIDVSIISYGHIINYNRNLQDITYILFFSSENVYISRLLSYFLKTKLPP